MKILITSGGGLATELYRTLRDEHDVRVLRRRPDPAFGPACVVGDLMRLDDVMRAAEGCDLVFHTAVRNNVDMTLDNYPQFLSSNVDGTFNLMLAAVRLKTPRLVCSSTSMVLGFQRWSGQTPPDGRAVRTHDDQPYHATCIYSHTKVLAESTVNYFREHHGVNAISLRYGWLAPLHLYRDSSKIQGTLGFQFHPDDAVAANLLAARSNQTGSYLIGCAPDFTEQEAQDLWRNPRAVLERRFPRELAYYDRQGWPIRPIATWLDHSAATRDLGYRPRHDFSWYVAQHEAGAFGPPPG